VGTLQFVSGTLGLADFMRLIGRGNVLATQRLLQAQPALAHLALADSTDAPSIEFYMAECSSQIYAGDTA
jgi:hypothetical protein